MIIYQYGASHFKLYSRHKYAHIHMHTQGGSYDVIFCFLYYYTLLKYTGSRVSFYSSKYLEFGIFYN